MSRRIYWLLTSERLTMNPRYERGSCPAARCQGCARRHSGWHLVEKVTCECGGKLVIDFPYDVLIGYVRAGNRQNGSLPVKGDSQE